MKNLPVELVRLCDDGRDAIHRSVAQNTAFVARQYCSFLSLAENLVMSHTTASYVWHVEHDNRLNWVWLLD